MQAKLRKAGIHLVKPDAKEMDQQQALLNEADQSAQELWPFKYKPCTSAEVC